MESLRIALYTDSTIFAGSERHIADLAWGLKRSGAAVSVACPARSPLARAAESHGISLLPIEKNGLADWHAVATLSGHLRTGKLDIVHAHNGRTAFLAAAARSLAGRGCLVRTEHFLAPAHLGRTGLSGALSRAAHRRLNRACDQIIAVSQAVRNAAAERDLAAAEKTVVIPNGIRPPRAPRILSPAVVRARLGIPPETFLILCAARLEPEKDLTTLIDAMAIVSRSHPNACCFIAGEGAQRARLQTAIACNALEKHAILLGYRSDIASLLRAANLVVLPSPAEPFGLALLEAMAFAKPVAAACAGGPAEIVTEGVTGLLFPPGNAAVLASQILRLAKDPALAACMGEAGLSRYRAEFTVERMVRATLAAYASC